MRDALAIRRVRRRTDARKTMPGTQWCWMTSDMKSQYAIYCAVSYLGATLLHYPPHYAQERLTSFCHNDDDDNLPEEDYHHHHHHNKNL